MTRNTQKIATTTAATETTETTTLPGASNKAQAVMTLKAPTAPAQKAAPSRLSGDAFKLPPDVLDDEGNKINYADDACALASFFLVHGRFPETVRYSDIHNAFAFSMGTPPRTICRAFRLPLHSCSWSDVYVRIADLARYRLQSPRIAEALALPIEDHFGQPVTWNKVLEHAGADLPVSSALGPITHR